jgi:hypothetical protein
MYYPMIQNKVDHLPLLFSLQITVLHDTNESIDPPNQPSLIKMVQIINTYTLGTPITLNSHQVV